MRALVAVGVLAAALLTSGIGAVAQPATLEPVEVDFNGDGFADLVIPAPGEDLAGVNGGNAGAVHVLYGGPGGLAASGTQFFTQNSPGMPDQAELNDQWGNGDVVAADFDADGIDDLAVGAGCEDVGEATDAGAVTVLYGTSAGLDVAGSQFLESGQPWHPRRI